MKTKLSLGLMLIFASLSMYSQSDSVVSFKTHSPTEFQLTNADGETVIVDVNTLVLPSGDATEAKVSEVKREPLPEDLTGETGEAPIVVNDPLSSVINVTGDAAIWDLSNVNLDEYKNTELGVECGSLINPVDFLNGAPSLMFNYTESGDIDTVYSDVFTKSGSYVATFDAIGKLILPSGKVYQNARKVNIVESYRLEYLDNSNYCVDNVNEYSYFFTEHDNEKAILVYSEKSKKDCTGSLNEYYKEICLPEHAEAFITQPTTEYINWDSIVNLTCTPNLVSSATTVSCGYYLPEDAQVTLSVATLAGKSMFVIGNYSEIKGDYTKQFSAYSLIAGTYVITLEFNGKVVKKQFSKI